MRIVTAIVRIPHVLRKQGPLHADEALQPRDVQELHQGRQVRLELLRIGRGPREASGQRRRPTQLLSIPQVSAHRLNHRDPLVANLSMAL